MDDDDNNDVVWSHFDDDDNKVAKGDETGPQPNGVDLFPSQNLKGMNSFDDHMISQKSMQNDDDDDTNGEGRLTEDPTDNCWKV